MSRAMLKSDSQMRHVPTWGGHACIAFRASASQVQRTTLLKDLEDEERMMCVGCNLAMNAIVVASNFITTVTVIALRRRPADATSSIMIQDAKTAHYGRDTTIAAQGAWVRSGDEGFTPGFDH
jgi:hypothetical protein